MASFLEAICIPLAFLSMHPRNPYANNPPEFAQLGRDVPELQQFLLPSSQHGFSIDFRNPAALRTLTSALLKRDFGLTIHLPDDRLCPAIPGRLDYCLLMQDIVEADRTICKQLGLRSARKTIYGLDIGTGASAIYPMLLCRLAGDVCMVGSDIDSTSLYFAKQNVNDNGLHNRVSIIATTSEESFFAKALQVHAELDFTMCNPPFYSSAAEIDQLAEDKDFAPHAVCTGSENEMITEGGEVVFISRMIEGSATCGQQIRWFSSLLGNASSVIHIVKQLAKHECTNYAVVELVQSYTQRWVIVWSWQAVRLPDSIARQIPPGYLTRSQPDSNTLSYTFSALPQQHTLFDIVQVAICGVALDVSTIIAEEGRSARLLVKAATISWTRSARRSQASCQVDTGSQVAALAMVCEISFNLASRAPDGQDLLTYTLDCEWKYGLERQAFHSFFSYLARKLAAQLKTSERASLIK